MKPSIHTMRHPLRRGIARILIASTAVLGMPLPAAHAELISTEQAVAHADIASAAQSRRGRLAALLARAEVRAELARQGVDPDEAAARAAALSDAQIDAMAGRIDALPAGGDFGGIIGAAVFVFLVLLITDVLGLTKVFSFTRPIK